MPNLFRVVRLSLCTASVAVMSTACSTADDGERGKIVAAVLTQLASDGKPVCVDGKTSGHPLDLWKRVALAPQNPIDKLRWQTPLPLRLPAVGDRHGYRDAYGSLAQWNVGHASLDRDASIRVTAIARRLALRVDESQAVRMSQSWVPKGVKARWWVSNRLSADCDTVYILSNPAIERDIAFVAVVASGRNDDRGGRWGTVYAVRKTGNAWATFAQWIPWLQ